MVSRRQCTFCTRAIGLDSASSAAATERDLCGARFQLWRPQASIGDGRLASISSAFQQQRRQQQPPSVALFSVSKADTAAADGVQHNFRIVKIAPDGKCMFRALASGMSYNQGFYIVGSEEEEADADALRLAAADALCRGAKRRGDFKEAVFALETEGTLGEYCQRLQSPTFWGGNVELLVLSKMLHVPITVYQSQTEAKRLGGGFLPIAKYGEEYVDDRKPVALLYRDGNHYDLLTP